MSKLTIDRLLQSQGFGARKWCQQLVADGEVSINGEIVSDYRQAIETADLKFSVYGEEWQFRQHIYLALNKPTDYEC